MNKKSIVPIVASATIIAASAYSPTHAVIADYIEKFANNNITFYNPEEPSHYLLKNYPTAFSL